MTLPEGQTISITEHERASYLNLPVFILSTTTYCCSLKDFHAKTVTVLDNL